MILLIMSRNQNKWNSGTEKLMHDVSGNIKYRCKPSRMARRERAEGAKNLSEELITNQAGRAYYKE
jgi:hypothetical protein